MTADLDLLATDLLARIGAAADLAALDGARVAALGKQGSVSALLKTLGGMTPEQRQSEGPRINGLREAVAAAIAARRADAGDGGAGCAAGGRAARHEPARRGAPRRVRSTRSAR